MTARRPARRAPLPAGAGWPAALAAHQPVALAAAVLSLLLAVAVFADRAFYLGRDTLDPATHQLFRAATRIGKADWSILLAAVLCLCCFRVARRAGRHRRAVLWREAGTQAGFILTVLLVSGLAANVLKWGLGRARPSIAGPEGVFLFDPVATSAGWASFPSGHTTTGVALAVALGFLAPRLRLLFLSVAFWIGASRVVVGAHWASDVVGGAVLGLLTALLLRHWYARRSRVFVWRDGRLKARTRGILRLLRAEAARLRAAALAELHRRLINPGPAPAPPAAAPSGAAPTGPMSGPKSGPTSGATSGPTSGPAETGLSGPAGRCARPGGGSAAAPVPAGRP